MAAHSTEVLCSCISVVVRRRVPPPKISTMAAIKAMGRSFSVPTLVPRHPTRSQDRIRLSRRQMASGHAPKSPRSRPPGLTLMRLPSLRHDVCCGYCLHHDRAPLKLVRMRHSPSSSHFSDVQPAAVTILPRVIRRRPVPAVHRKPSQAPRDSSDDAVLTNGTTSRRRLALPAWP